MDIELSFEESARFLKLLYGNSEGSIVIATLPKLRTVWVKASDDEAIKVFIKSENNQKLNLHFNFGLQDKDAAKIVWDRKQEDSENVKDFKYCRGNEKTVIALPGLNLDIDIKGPNHAETNLPESLDEAMEIVNYFPLPPSIIVSTGGGIHVYWLFKEHLIFNNEYMKENGKILSKSFQEYFRKRASERGWHIDNTSDLARMMRLPGTINWKNKDNPLQVKMIQCNEDIRYEIQQFTDIVGFDSKSKTKNEVDVQTMEFETNTAEIDKIVDGCAWIKHARDDAANLPEPEWHAMNGIVGRCKDGQKIVHKWSSPYPGYTYEETEQKLQHAIDSAGPRTCENIAELTCGRYCNQCKNNGKVKSPIVLGMKKYDKSLGKDEAIEIAKKAIELVKAGDMGAHLTEEVLQAFAILQKYNKPEFARLRAELKILKVPLKEFNNGIKAAEKLIEIRHTEHREEHFISNMVFEKEKNINGIIPPGYLLKNSGVYKEVITDELVYENQIAYYPLVISGRYKDINEGQELIELSWHKGKTQSAIVDRGIVADSRKLLKLASAGVPVHSGNSQELVYYLAAFEAFNNNTLPINFVTSHIGWQGMNGNKGFLINDTLISTDDESLNITFNPTSSGEIQTIQAFHSKGNFEEWKKTIERIKDYPRVQMLFYAAFATVLLEPLKAPNFIIELANRTSTGKTTSLRVAASVWGSPNERKNESVINSWDATMVWLERTAGMLNGIPLMLDDTKRAKYPEIIAKMIYSIANGKGRGRGDLNGIANTKSWNTIMLSTAETPSVYTTKDGGTRGRVLEITGMPFGIANEKNRKLVAEITMGVIDNYGFAGPMFANYVIENRNKWPEWKTELRKLIDKYSGMASSEVSGRLAEYAALISFSKIHVDALLDLPLIECDPVKELWSEIVEESKDATGEKEALDYVVSWAYSHYTSFDGRHKDSGMDPLMPSAGWSGVWSNSADYEYIAFLPSVLKEILVRAGYDYNAIIRGWRELNWLDYNPKRASSGTKQVRFFNNPTWMVVIKKTAIDNLKEMEKDLDEEFFYEEGKISLF